MMEDLSLPAEIILAQKTLKIRRSNGRLEDAIPASIQGSLVLFAVAGGHWKFVPIAKVIDLNPSLFRSGRE